MVKELRDKLLRISFHSAQSSMRSVVYNVVEQMTLRLIGKDVITEALHTYKVEFFDIEAATDGS